MDRYYYDQRRLDSRESGRGRRALGFLFPFILLIILGVVGVLGFNLFVSFYGGGGEDGNFMYVVEGQAQLKMWGTDDFSRAYNGTRVLQGDELYTAKDSKVVVEFFDGTVARVDGATQVVFNEIYNKAGEAEIQLVLKSGGIWVNKTSVGGYDTDFLVLTNNVLVQADAGDGGVILDAENRGEVESVRVVYGAVDIDVYSQNGGTVVDHITVEEGNEAVFDEDRLDKFWKFQAPNVVGGISDEFKELNWYVWNFLEDEDPSDFRGAPVEELVEVEPELVEEVEPVEEFELVEDEEPIEEIELLEEEELIEEPVLNLGPLTSPEILQIDGVDWEEMMFEEGMVVVGEPIKVVGNVQGADKVVINGYELQRFEPKEGAESFVYWISEEYENLVVGENIYEVYALAPDGTRSASTNFKVIYEVLETEVLGEKLD
jgi:hypothetical protein